RPDHGAPGLGRLRGAGNGSDRRSALPDAAVPRAHARARERGAGRAILRADRRSGHHRAGAQGGARAAGGRTRARRADPRLAGEDAEARPQLGGRSRSAALHRLNAWMDLQGHSPWPSRRFESDDPLPHEETPRMRTLLPEGWAAPIGYANGIEVDAGRIVFVAGQVGWDEQQK